MQLRSLIVPAFVVVGLASCSEEVRYTDQQQCASPSDTRIMMRAS